MQEPLPPVPVQKEGESQKTRKLYWKGMESLSADNAELYLRPVLLEKNYGHKVPSLSPLCSRKWLTAGKHPCYVT